MPSAKKSRPPKAKGLGRYPSVEKPKYYGITFDSKREGKHYLDLRDRLKHGLIRDLELQPRIAIVIGGVPVRYPSGRQMIYIGDFRYFDVKLGKTILEDAKGHRADKYTIKRALLHTMGLKINEV